MQPPLGQNRLDLGVQMQVFSQARGDLAQVMPRQLPHSPCVAAEKLIIKQSSWRMTQLLARETMSGPWLCR